MMATPCFTSQIQTFFYMPPPPPLPPPFHGRKKVGRARWKFPDKQKAAGPLYTGRWTTVGDDRRKHLIFCPPLIHCLLQQSAQPTAETIMGKWLCPTTMQRDRTGWSKIPKSECSLNCTFYRYGYFCTYRAVYSAGSMLTARSILTFIIGQNVICICKLGHDVGDTATQVFV